MKSILYTGTRPPKGFGGEVEHLPMLAIEFHPIDESGVRDFAERPCHFVFYSRNGVRSVADQTRLLNELPPAASVWAVGSRTSEELAAHGVRAESPSDQRFAGLIEELPGGRLISFEIADGDRSLAEERPNDEVLTVVAYASKAASIPSDFWDRPPLPWVVFTSPRGFASFASHDGAARWFEVSRLAAIGPTTAEAMEAAGHPPDHIAAKPDADELIESLLSIDGPG